VVLLFPRPALTFNPLWTAGREIRLGEAMASYAAP
jgi:phosphatidylserine decarboxylase